jgi:hypothetical protein
MAAMSDYATFGFPTIFSDIHCTDKGSHGSNLQSWSACYRVLDRDWGFTESLTMDNSVKRVWRVPRSLHAKDLFFEFYQRVNAL